MQWLTRLGSFQLGTKFLYDVNIVGILIPVNHYQGMSVRLAEQILSLINFIGSVYSYKDRTYFCGCPEGYKPLGNVGGPDGHMVTGLGACLKNLGMGLASRAGKLRQHSSVAPAIKEDKCRYCRKCMQWCPAEAIGERRGKAFIDPAKCMGCGECLTVCRYDAVRYNWGTGSERLQKSMVEHALGVLKGKRDKCFFYNVLVDMTADCDCMGRVQRKILPDIGILAATDPVAIDAATLDLTRRHGGGRTLAEKAYAELDPMVQLRHAEKLGMGSINYELVTV